MGTAKAFNDILKHELNIYAAWLPVSNTFRLGDYGLFSDGVLVKVGNITDFGVTFAEEDGPSAALDFASEGTRIIRTIAGAAAEVLPEADVEAKLTIQFARESSFLLKANLVTHQMRNINEVASKLNSVDDWENRFRVVSAVYFGQDCLIISSKADNSTLEICGKANALKQLGVGSIGADIGVTSADKIGLQIVGKAGVVGVGLFKLRWPFGRTKILEPLDRVPIEIHDTWPKDLPDDV